MSKGPAPAASVAEALELRHLRGFVAVAEELNFRRAAERLYITQPALTRQIQALERLIGSQLLVRSTRQVELTPAGAALLERTRPVLHEVDAAVSAAQSVGGELVARMGRVWEPLIISVAAGDDIEKVRNAYEAVHAHFTPPPEVVVQPVNARGVPALVVGEQNHDAPSMLYLHGGGYLLGSAFGYRSHAGALALASRRRAVVPDYRLAPEHPFPAALDDVIEAYRWLLERGTDPEEVVLCGDSSGGGLAMSLLASLPRRGLPNPGAAILLCPWLDLGRGTPLEDAGETGPVDEAQRFAAAYLGGHPTDDPIINPYVGDLTGLPPLLVQAATGDELLPDAQGLVERAQAHGVDAHLEVYPIDAHVFQIFWSFLPLASEALQSAGHFADLARTESGPGTA
jgi:epsilon-lactone hydrolase